LGVKRVAEIVVDQKVVTNGQRVVPFQSSVACCILQAAPSDDQRGRAQGSPRPRLG
jgi:hypothetical protein